MESDHQLCVTMDKKLDNNRFVALWSKSISDDSISVALKYRRQLNEDMNLSLSLNESFLVKSSLYGRLSKNIAYDIGLFFPLKPQNDETTLLIESPLFFKFNIDT